MARKDTQLTKQVGEYLVAAELARRGLLSATFAGNVRHYDIVASGPSGGHVPVQVKAMASGDWQLLITDFADVSLAGDNQIVGDAKPEPYEHLVFVFVAVKAYATDQFYVIDWRSLRDILITAYKAYLAKHEGRRPKNPQSFHTAVSEEDLAPFRDRWDVITDQLQHAA